MRLDRISGAPRMRGLGAAGLVLLITALAGGQSADGACLQLAGDGSGGAGLQREGSGIDRGGGGEDDGIGGMGLTDLSVAELDRLRASGFAPSEDTPVATGIYGTITGLGGACLNGLRVLIPKHTLLEQGSEWIGRENLRVGHVVSLTAANFEGTFAVSSTSLRSAIEGPVTAVDPQRRELEVMGQRIELIADAVIEGEDWSELSLEAFEPGDIVVVYGLRGTNRTVIASHVSRRGSSRDLASVRGLLAIESGTASVGGVPIVSLERSELAAGRWVVATGYWNSELKSLVRVRLEASFPVDSDVAEVSVEALVRVGDAGNEIFAAGLRIETSDLTTRIIEDLPEGTRLWLRGRRISDDRIEVRYIRVAPAHLFTPLDPSGGEQQWRQETQDLLPGLSRLNPRRRRDPSTPLHAGQTTGRPVQSIRQGLIPR